MDLFGPAPSVELPNNKCVNSKHVAFVGKDEMNSVFENRFVDTLTVPNSREERIVFGIKKGSIEVVNGHF